MVATVAVMFVWIPAASRGGSADVPSAPAGRHLIGLVSDGLFCASSHVPAQSSAPNVPLLAIWILGFVELKVAVWVSSDFPAASSTATCMASTSPAVSDTLGCGLRVTVAGGPTVDFLLPPPQAARITSSAIEQIRAKKQPRDRRMHPPRHRGGG